LREEGEGGREAGVGEFLRGGGVWWEVGTYGCHSDGLDELVTMRGKGERGREGGKEDLPDDLLGLGGVSEEQLDFGGSEVLGVNLDQSVPGVGLVVAHLVDRALLALPLNLHAVLIFRCVGTRKRVRNGG